ncbi:c-type cytochrome [Methylocella tundrae]|uniref:Cytochrome c domain-containing protein n=1 Tax=Methylocella tundrae TaxID=227605 RepID=A0A4U8Z2K3_METTU|nr:transporter substrate-binding domain-containing protein [Methylocella tundrae]WPP03463.1 transporter substrate-binding domain-containing protein [Methylocella tundrae]VFU09550.1 conserved exported protein of unknown function [Methylocella tundrae]
MTSKKRRQAPLAIEPRKAGVLPALAAALFIAAGPAASALPSDGAAGGDALTICADPDDLPFSAQAGDAKGIYIELGGEIANALGRPLKTVWSQTYFGKRAIRETLLSGKCDAYIGLPDSKNFMGPKLIFSKPFLRIGYALVSPKAQGASSLTDLAGKRVAVQFGTSPELLLADHGDIQPVTVLDPEAAMKALAAGRADAAIIWGPSAGYLNKTLYQDAYSVRPASGEGMQWPVSVGFARASGDLRDKIDRVIDEKAEAIAALAAKYGFPQAEPISLTAAASAGGSKPSIMLASQEKPASETAPATAHEAAAPAPGSTALTETPAAAATPASAADPAAIAAGREIFNGTCSHCHGPDAIVGQRRINLRLLSQRYSDKMDEVFHYTVTHGRPDKGMPNWTGVFSEDDFSKILAYLHSVQQN